MDIIKKSEEFAKEEYKKNDSEHGWNHIAAVRKRALELARNFRGVDIEILELAVIFHDIGYHQGRTAEERYTQHAENSVKTAERFLVKNRYPQDRIEKIKQAILDHSTPHRKRFGDAKSIEGKLIYDADKTIFITTKETYAKYFPLLYLSESRNLVKKFGK
ncbi:MAG: HD domain-containing protein [Candidatus Aenigmatarchaeota archaeon]